MPSEYGSLTSLESQAGHLEEGAIVAETSLGTRPSRSTLDMPLETLLADKKEVELQSIDLSSGQVSHNQTTFKQFQSDFCCSMRLR